MRGIKSIGPKLWQVRVKVTDPRTGQVKEARKQCKGTRAEAERCRVELREQLLEGVPRERPTLGEFAASWLRARAPRLKVSTVDRYGRDLSGWILPALGGWYIDAIRPSDVDGWVSSMVEAGQAPGSVRLRLCTLRMLARAAVHDQLVDRDFTAGVRAPQVEGYTDEEPNLLTAEELERFLGAIRPHWRAAATLIGLTGMRWGELSALRWEDVDEDAGCIRVRRTNYRGLAQAPKTRAARRVYPLTPALAEVLHQHRARTGGGELVFPSRSGGMYRSSAMSKAVKDAARDAGIKHDITTHGLRRTFNDLARRVTDEIVLRSLMGHTSRAMTEHYSRPRLAEKRDAVEAVGRLVLLRGGKEDAA